MDFLRAVVLGVIQGLTEFLPISSSAHLAIFPKFFGWDDPGAAYTAVIQIGTEVAVVLYFWRDIWTIGSGWVRGVFSSVGSRGAGVAARLVHHRRLDADRAHRSRCWRT